MGLLIPVVFWVGVFSAVWELLYARRHGGAITRAEKRYLALIVPVAVSATFMVSMMGLPRPVPAAFFALAVGMALAGWAIGRRVRRRGRASGSRMEGRAP